MALNKHGMDLKAINRDQKAIDSLPNKGRASSHSKALEAKKGKEECRYCGGKHKDQEHYLTTKPYYSTSGMRKGRGGTDDYGV